MVVCHLHIISLKPGVTIAAFLSKLTRHGIKPVFQARILRWMILPTRMSAGHLLGRNTHWDLLLALQGDSTTGSGTLPAPAQTDIAAIWTVSSGLSSRALAGYAKLNEALLTQARESAPQAELLPETPTSDSAQNLEFSAELAEWIASLPTPIKNHPVSMLNLLAFNPGKKEQYVQYGTEFSKRVGSRHGGRVKLVGRVVEGGPGEAARDGWDEIAYVHYPSVKHFAAMAASKDYQEVNERYRLGALRDTFILCVQEVDGRGELVAGRGASKL